MTGGAPPIAVGDEELRVRARPEWDFAIGDSLYACLPSAKCIGISEEHVGPALSQAAAATA